jgi:HK97 family phage major capsid protein
LSEVLGVAQVHLSNNQLIPTLAMINPADALDLFMKKDTQGRRLGRVDRMPDGTILVDGLPVIVNSAVEVGFAYVGDFNEWAEIKDYQALTIRMSETVDDYELKNKVALIVESQIAAANYNPLAFMKVDISTAITDLTATS